MSANAATDTASDALLAAMRQHGVIGGGRPMPPADLAEDRPWFITLLQGLAGWVAGILLLAFVGLLMRPDTSIEILAVGLVLLTGAWLMYFADRHAVFLDQLALAMSIAGQLAVAWAILKDSKSTQVVALTLLALQCFVYLVMPNKVARTLAVFFACIAWTYAVRLVVFPDIGDGLFFDNYHQARVPLFGAWSTLISWLGTWGPIIVLMIWLLIREPAWMASRARTFARPALNGLLLGAALGSFAGENFVTFFLQPEHLGWPLSWWALFPLLSFALTMLVAHCAFRLRSRGMLGLAIFAALLRLSWFYYQYGTSLLWKSVIMLVIGALLLAGGRVLQQRFREAA